MIGLFIINTVIWGDLIYYKKLKFLSVNFCQSYPHEEIMNRNFIFVFILLAALSIVNAIPHKLFKRETVFGKCDFLTNPPPQLTVKLSPDPVAPQNPDTFTISGQLDQDMTADVQVFGYFYDPKSNKIIGDFHTTPVCKNGAFPIIYY